MRQKGDRLQCQGTLIVHIKGTLRSNGKVTSARNRWQSKSCHKWIYRQTSIKKPSEQTLTTSMPFTRIVGQPDRTTTTPNPLGATNQANPPKTMIRPIPFHQTDHMRRTKERAHAEEQGSKNGCSRMTGRNPRWLQGKRERQSTVSVNTRACQQRRKWCTNLN